MNNEFEKSSSDESIHDENQFLKMKMMLEHGAQVGSSAGVDPRLENAFLKNVMAFEKEYEKRKTIKLYDKIDRPTIFKAVAEISDEEIKNALDSLQSWLSEYNIDVSVCSPNISPRELYRFITEELFEYEMDDMDLPGWTDNFLYDEFHPDDIFENTNAAKDDCVRDILQKAPVNWLPHFRNQNICLNQHTALTVEEFMNIVNRFKLVYDDLEIKKLSNAGCVIEESSCRVTGEYVLISCVGKEECTFSGNWTVLLEKDEQLGYWYINNVQIEGIHF